MNVPVGPLLDVCRARGLPLRVNYDLASVRLKLADLADRPPTVWRCEVLPVTVAMPEDTPKPSGLEYRRVSLKRGFPLGSAATARHPFRDHAAAASARAELKPLCDARQADRPVSVLNNARGIG
jgi:hypothetical protein